MAKVDDFKYLGSTVHMESAEEKLTRECRQDGMVGEECQE